MKRYFIIPTVLTLVAGCGPSEPPRPDASAPASPPAVEETTPSASPSPSSDASLADRYLISGDGIGLAKLGMTYGQLKQVQGPGVEYEVRAPFSVDFDAIAVSQEGAVQFYILYLSGQTFSDTDVIQGLLTDNPTYQTPEEVGPGTTLSQAESVYGNATLSYNLQNEGREYVRFEQQPSANLAFSTGNANQQTAGIYPSTSGDFNETQEFREDAPINSVLVVCISESCVQAENSTP